jgi:hypothetical protein
MKLTDNKLKKETEEKGHNISKLYFVHQYCDHHIKSVYSHPPSSVPEVGQDETGCHHSAFHGPLYHPSSYTTVQDFKKQSFTPLHSKV